MKTTQEWTITKSCEFPSATWYVSLERSESGITGMVWTVGKGTYMGTPILTVTLPFIGDVAGIVRSLPGRFQIAKDLFQKCLNEMDARGLGED